MEKQEIGKIKTSVGNKSPDHIQRLHNFKRQVFK